MPCPSIVRAARPEDHMEIWRLFLHGYRENALFPIAPEKVDWFIGRALRPDLIQEWDNGIRGAIGVIGPVGSLEAIVFVVLGEYWYTRHKHIEEFIVFTDPEHRKGSHHTTALHEWMKEQVDRTNLPLVTGIMSNIRTEAKCRLYARHFTKIGEFFFLGPKGSIPFQTVAVSS
jgi:hypothetical protein